MSAISRTCATTLDNKEFSFPFFDASLSLPFFVASLHLGFRSFNPTPCSSRDLTRQEGQ